MIGFRLALGALLLASPSLAEETPPPCPSDTMPVVTLGFGSRYAADSADRSEFDEDSDKAVTAALKPIDDFIADLARQANLMNDPSTDPELATKAAACVEESLLAWARAGALSDLTTQGANLSAPSRVGGIAFAYAALRAHQPDAGGNPEIEAWLLARARQTIAFFDTEAPPKAAQNNLRAWAGLAVARIGLTLEDPVLIDWAETSVRLVACAAEPDGSLPYEMWRGRLALHYQLHAVAPLVTTAALLSDARPGLFAACDKAIPRAVAFTLAALQDPSPVVAITGKVQTVGGKDRPPRDFELAWAAAYLRFNPSPDLAKLVEGIEVLGNSKLGGDQRLLWPTPADPAPSDG